MEDVQNLGKWRHNSILSVTDSISGKMLGCGLHTCPDRCHQLQDHSKMRCLAIISSKCANSHTVTRKCYDKAAGSCKKCESEARAREKKRQRDYKLDKERETKRQAYAAQLAEMEDQLEHQKRLLKDQCIERDQQQVLAQKKQDLQNLKKMTEKQSRDQKSLTAEITQAVKDKLAPPDDHVATSSLSGGKTQSHPDSSAGHEEKQPDLDKSNAKDDWEWQKRYEGALNDALDSLMSMIGLSTIFQVIINTDSSRLGVCQTEIPRHQDKNRYCCPPKRVTQRGAIWGSSSRESWNR